MTAQSQAITRAPQQPSTAIALFSRTEREPGAITAALKRAATEFHLVSPATACGALPEGCSVAFSSVLVNPETDTYDTKGGGKRGLHRHVLDKIANAAAVSWDPRESRRLDSGADSHYCRYQAVGRYTHFDGRQVTIIGEKEMDLREGSPQIAGKSEKEIAMQRSHILAHCATKARLRAIAAMGVKRSYTREELMKPFVVARLMFTGATEDPGLRREFALLQARKMLGLAPELPAHHEEHAPAFALLPPRPAPPLASTRPDDDDFGGPSRPPPVDDDHGEPQTTPANETPQQATAQPPDAPMRDAELAPDEAPARSGLVIPGGRAKGTPIEDADDRDLTYWADRIEQALADGSGRPEFRERDETLVRAMRAELACRD